MTSIGRWATVAAVLGIAAFAIASPSWAACALPDGRYDFDFSDTAYPDCFRDVLRGNEISAGTDWGGTGHSSLNFAGSAGAAKATWLTLVDQAPENTDQDNIYGSEIICADVLVQRFDNEKGPGILTLFNQGKGNRGLALVLQDAGNTDRLSLVTVDGDPAQQGKMRPVKHVALDSTIQENAWYRLVFTVLLDTGVQIMGQVFRHEVPSDPNSAIIQVGPTLTWDKLPEGVSSLGQNGLVATAAKAVVNSSVTNFTNIAANCTGGGSTTAR